jgi:hypothetical protein
MKLFRHVKSFLGQCLFTIILAAIIPVVLSVNCVYASSSSKQIVGGPCTYKQYRGNAQIVSVIPGQNNSGGYEVKFLFYSKKSVKEEFAMGKDKRWLLIMNDFSDPSEDFVKKYDIQSGKRFPCIMKVITKGTCTPVMFDFPTLDRNRVR